MGWTATLKISPQQAPNMLLHVLSNTWQEETSRGSFDKVATVNVKLKPATTVQFPDNRVKWYSRERERLLPWTPTYRRKEERNEQAFIVNLTFGLLFSRQGGVFHLLEGQRVQEVSSQGIRGVTGLKPTPGLYYCWNLVDAFICFELSSANSWIMNTLVY